MIAESQSLDSLLNPKTCADLHELRNKLQAKCFTLSDTQLTLKQFIDWRKVGLIPPTLNSYEKGKRNRIEINVFEYIWLDILLDLKALGIANLALKKITEWAWAKIDLKETISKMLSPEILTAVIPNVEEKEKIMQTLLSATQSDLEEFAQSDQAEPVYPFESLFLQVFTTNADFKIIYRYDGLITGVWDHQIFRDSDTNEKVSAAGVFNTQFAPHPHFSFGVAKYLSKFLCDDNKLSFLKPLGMIDEDEQELLELIRRGNLKQLIVKFDAGSGRMSGYELHKDRNLTLEESNQIRKILALKDYESITYKSKSNKTVYLEKTTQKRFS